MQKYYKLKDRYDVLSEQLGYAPDMKEFSQHLGTDRLEVVSGIMTNGPKQKAAMIRHNMGLVFNMCKKYDNPDVPKEVRAQLLLQALRLPLIAMDNYHAMIMICDCTNGSGS